MSTYHLAPEDLSQKLWTPDITACDVLSSFLDKCCSNDMFCVDFLNDHAIVPVCDLHEDQWDAVLTHLLNRKCVSVFPTPSCKLFACGALLTTCFSCLLCTLLLDVYQDQMIASQSFSLCCTSLACMPQLPALDVN